MNNIGKIKVKNFDELVNMDIVTATPKTDNGKVKNARKKYATTTKKVRQSTSKKNAPAEDLGQLRISSFFKSCTKSYRIDLGPIVSTRKDDICRELSEKKRKMNAKSPRKTKTKKRLFEAETETETYSISSLSDNVPLKQNPKVRKSISPVKKQPSRKVKKAPKIEQIKPTDFVDLCSDSEECVGKLEEKPNTLIHDGNENKSIDTKPVNNKLPRVAENISKPMVTIPINNISPTIAIEKTNDSSTDNVKTVTNGKRTRKPRPCPPYKIVEGTSFAVDAFQFGEIPNVTHYFLTHFHADHYIGLTQKFSMPLYASPITACLIRAFIPPANPNNLHEIELYKPLKLENVEVIAIDANHCPGAVMFIFKLETGECILHTGDFRACAEMESEPIFWNNNIDLIYLDTTYLSDKYAFCHQEESIDNAKELVHSFREKNKDKRILYVCGSYVIGKEKFWTALAHEFELTVWAEPNRRKALEAMQLPSVTPLLRNRPEEANLHIITMGKISYMSLCEYFRQFENNYDMLLAVRPSGWEKNSRPQYRGRINIVGVEYSEHSSFNEMERFVKFLNPQRVISTVPVSRDLFITGKVPSKWYNYKKLTVGRNLQPSITNYLKLNTSKNIFQLQSVRKTKVHRTSADQTEQRVSQELQENAECVHASQSNKTCSTIYESENYDGNTDAESTKNHTGNRTLSSIHDFEQIVDTTSPRKTSAKYEKGTEIIFPTATTSKSKLKTSRSIALNVDSMKSKQETSILLRLNIEADEDWMS